MLGFFHKYLINLSRTVNQWSQSSATSTHADLQPSKQSHSAQVAWVNPSLSVFTGVVSNQLHLPSQMQTEELPKGLVWFSGEQSLTFSIWIEFAEEMYFSIQCAS